MTLKMLSWGKTLLMAVGIGVSFNISQRALDWLLDHAFANVTFLAWLK